MPPSTTFGRIGSYTLLATVAQGGMARVYLARHEVSGRLCVLKQLHQDLEEHATATLRFRREAAIASRIDHPNVAKIVDSGWYAGRFYIAVEFIAGQTVEDLMKASPVPPSIAIAIVDAVLDGLTAAHEATDDEGQRLSIVHRDISPRNVMVSYEGEVKIIDFGIARAEIDSFRTSPGVVIGSLGYMAPEQALTLGLDARSDLYSVGVVLYELLTGDTLFPHGDVKEGLRRIVHETPPALRAIKPELPASLDVVVRKAMAKLPNDRYQSASEFREELLASRVDPATPDEISAFVRSLFGTEERETRWLMQAASEVDRSAPVELDDLEPPSWSLEDTDPGEDIFDDPTELADPGPRTPPPSTIQDPLALAEAIRTLGAEGGLIISLGAIPLDEALLLLHEARFTGVFEVGNPPSMDRVFLRNGAIVGTSAAPLLETQLLKNALTELGVIDATVLDSFPRGLKDLDPDLLGGYLLERGLIDSKQLARVRAEQAVYRVFGLFNRRDRIARIREGASQLADFTERPVDLRPVIAYGIVIRSDLRRREAVAERLRNKRIRSIAPYDERRNHYWLSPRIMQAIRPLAEDGIELGDRPGLPSLDEATALGVLLLLERLALLEVDGMDTFDLPEVTVRVSSTPSG